MRFFADLSFISFETALYAYLGMKPDWFVKDNAAFCSENDCF